MSLYRRWIHKWERSLTLKDTNRRVFPFDWGLEWVPGISNERDPPLSRLRRAADHWIADSNSFFRAPPLQDWCLRDDHLTFPSPVRHCDASNRTVHARLFWARDRRRAVVLVPQWNADPKSHLGLCRLLKWLGISVLRLSLPYHEQRRLAGTIRADHMVSPNLGRTLAVTRQAVLEVSQSVQWLRQQGYQSVGVVGTSIGSCIAYLSFVHDRDIDVGVFNHVSAYFADVVWTGLSTRYVRWGLEDDIALTDLRQCWLPISPASYVRRLQQDPRPHLLITARYDLTFRPHLSERVFQEYARFNIPYQRAELPCGHYTTAHFPFKYLDGWHIARFLLRHLRERTSEAPGGCVSAGGGTGPQNS